MSLRARVARLERATEPELIIRAVGPGEDVPETLDGRRVLIIETGVPQPDAEHA